jgi:ribosomal protein S18 acetylase RimI-like enzyme
MPDDLTIRPGTNADADLLARFNRAMAEETEDKTLDPDTVHAGVEGMLSDPRKGFYLIAEMEGEPVGSLMITSEWSDWRNGTFWWIQSVYVRPEARQQGVYSALHHEVRARAQAADDVCGLRLYVEYDNATAQSVYEGLGMEVTSYRLYEEELRG